MRLSPLSLMGGAYADNSLTWSAQRTVNWLPETAEVEGTRTPVKFADVPGLRAVVDLGTGAPIRGMENVEGKLFAVSGTSLFEISTAFAATNRGNIPGVKRVSLAHNKQGGTVAANELVIANGLSGYVYNTDTATLSQITDEAFQGATTVDYVDGYITFTDPQGRFWGHSALNQATSFSSVDRYDAESAPDTIVSHIVSHREVMVFGPRTTEFFRNTGAATGTFQRVDGTELEVGICAPYARSRVDNSVCWVSDGLEVFRLEGHAPQRISDRPIEQLLATVNPANIFCFPWEDRGHKVFYITAPEAFTIGFDFASGMWHERQTFDLPRWRVNDLVRWNGYWIAGDYSNGLLYVLDWDTHHENGLPLVRERASGYTHGGQNKVLAPYVELLFDTGTDSGSAELPEITGDVPDGYIDEIVSGTYVVSGGIPPYGPIMVQSGTFPPGLTLDTDGSYAGAYTTPGNYSWTVGGTDSIGQAFSAQDSVVVSAVSWFASNALTAPTGFGIESPDGLDWSGAHVGNLRSQFVLSGGGKVVFTRNAEVGESTSDQGASFTPLVNGGNSYGGLYVSGVWFTTHTDGFLRRSTDSVTYTSINQGTSTGQGAMAAIPGIIINAGARNAGGSCARSLDVGLTWGNASLPLGLDDVAAGGVFSGQGAASNGVDRFVVVGTNNKIATSTDGFNWTPVTSPFGGTDTIRLVHWTGTRWIIANQSGQIAYATNSGAPVFTLSADVFGALPRAVSTAGLMTIMVGNAGTMKRSADGNTWTPMANNFGGQEIDGIARYSA